MPIIEDSWNVFWRLCQSNLFRVRQQNGEDIGYSKGLTIECKARMSQHVIMWKRRALHYHTRRTFVFHASDRAVAQMAIFCTKIMN